ncbi:hypothetical protein [Synoicihabitans lomoniglobus]|uniref:Lipid A biosynthesis acyltransferase n=1 Tax=Synoicihabitans lomoniglobus TaxID=2909285 RepID=A0AAF0CHL6_9BACT|nr:hypothetical protein [Opitutaceae bacterium LMO-M01]WED64457.1 hypothetical protein PXH66_19125 [Opitutaceae bacterium LMO-M01]
MPVAPRNPGPGWGYRFLLLCDRCLPEIVFRPLRGAGTFVALLFMPAQRAHSQTYLATIMECAPTWRDTWRHFFAFEESLMLKLRVAAGAPQPVELAPGDTGLREVLATEEPALLGTFHVGHSDIIGFLLGSHRQRRVSMVRLRVGNSDDTEQLRTQFGDWISFIWVNDPANLLFALKEAVAAGESIALKCDRLEFSAKTEVFDFLGARRRFPFTIYHLALIFQLPVVLSVGLPGGNGQSIVHCSPQFRADASSKAANLERARTHFQAFLHRLEDMLREDPYQWANFLPLNPIVP